MKKQGLSISAIAWKVGCDRKTVRKRLKRGLEAPIYGPRELAPISTGHLGLTKEMGWLPSSPNG
ncbi:hypothetical protein ACGYLC_13615, partial [Sulfitobacter sp. 1A12157]